jgi:hypothetical protein
MRHNMHSSRTVLALLENSNMSLHAGDKGAPGVSSDAKMKCKILDLEDVAEMR